MTHLILHKVRGEPAFDVAIKLMIGSEEGWIIPTSGHRAYPYWNLPLNKLDLPPASAPPTDWPDHYECSGAPPPPKFNIMALISPLMPKIKRRL
jgi:hypothetical protein